MSYYLPGQSNYPMDDDSFAEIQNAMMATSMSFKQRQVEIFKHDRSFSSLPSFFRNLSDLVLNLTSIVDSESTMNSF